MPVSRTFVVACFVAFVPVTSADAAVNAECKNFKLSNNVACNAYVTAVKHNLVFYYRYSRSTDKALATKARRLMFQKFIVNSRRTLLLRSAHWPRATERIVKLKIVVTDVANSRGLGEVRSQEIWEIRGPRTKAKKAGKLLWRDLGVRSHRTLMRQVGTASVWNVTALQ